MVPYHYGIIWYGVYSKLTIKVNKKRLNAGVLKPERVWAFYKLLALTEEYKRTNQFF